MKKYTFAAVTCLAVYWLSNSILWIPWKYAAWLGAVCMIIYVPIAWGGISKLCLDKFPAAQKKHAKYYLGLLFSVVAIISDVLFYVCYRGVPEQLFKPATFGAYVLCFAAPVIVGLIQTKRGTQTEKKITLLNWITAVAAAAGFIGTTFYVVRFW